MAILDDEDKQALRELAFGKVEKIKDKVWRAILLVGLALMQVVGVITLIRLHDSILDVWLLGGIFACGIGLIVVIASLKIFNGYHQQLRKYLFPITVLCCVYAAFAVLAPVYQVRHVADVGDTTLYAVTEERVSFVGTRSPW